MKLIRFNKDDINFNIRFSIEKNTIWVSQNDMSVLFKRTIPTISFHIKKNMDYINQNPSTLRWHQTVATNGKTYKMSYYNLDIIEIIGNKIDPLFIKEFMAGATNTNIFHYKNLIIVRWIEEQLFPFFQEFKSIYKYVKEIKQ